MTLMLRLFCCCLFIATGLPLLAQDPPNNESESRRLYEERIRKTRIDGVYIPKDETEAMSELDRLIDADSKAKLKAHTEEEAQRKLHFSFGLWMISNWSFYEGSRLSHYLRQNGVSYPDDMAQLLIQCYHRHISGKPLDFKGLAKTYKDKREAEFQESIDKNTIKTLGKKPVDSLKRGGKPAPVPGQ